MTTEQVWVGAICAAATALALVSVALARQARSRAERAEALVALLAERVGVLEVEATAQAPDSHRDSTYLITRLDSEQGPSSPAVVPVARPIDGRLFTDIVARETVVKAASWTHGLRRALTAETRNRIRFEVRQETRRAGRERRAETKQALREFRARARSAAPAPARDATEDVA